MYRPTPPARRGNILIVTLLLLVLFAVVGITVVYYSKNQAERARIAGEAQSGGDTAFPDNSRAAVNQFLGSFIYGAENYGPGLLDSTRGHSLMATTYGGLPGSTVAYNGVGHFSDGVSPVTGIDRRQQVNYRKFPGMTAIIDPEYSNPAGRPPGNAPLTPPTPPGTYVPKNAPYTYPDLNNLYLGSYAAATGEVTVPSYYRPWLFRDATMPPTATGLEPTNLNWMNAEGKYKIQRPRPLEHPNFPPVPPNADGSYTGDVQNLPGGVGPQRNDSIWIDVGLPSFVGPNGKRYKPLVAPLILDLDGRLNVSAHGNVMNGGDNASGQGFGPWEVSLQRALGTDGKAIVQARGLPQTRAGATAKTFYERSPFYPRPPGTDQLPAYASVGWTGFNAPNPLVIPSYPGGAFSSSPAYSGGYDSTNSQYLNHPSLFNPSEWPTTGGQLNRAYPLSDAKLLSTGYAQSVATYAQLDLGGGPLPDVRGNPTGPTGFPFVASPAANTPNRYRLDPAHGRRGLLTTHSFDLDRPGLMPAYVNLTTATSLALGPTGLKNPSTEQPYPTLPLVPGAVSDFAATQWQNVRAAVGAADLNRALADYRGADTTTPLSPTTVTAATATPAMLDRQRFARDLFGRLVVATGAQATVATATTPVGTTIYQPGDVIVTATAGTPEFNAVRALAQIAANIVDYIDADDINTVFVWNPTLPADPFNVANFTPVPPDVIGNHVVFGTEKSRLVVNEAYAELVNDPVDPETGMNMAPASPAHVRFWIELLNPTGQPYATPNAGPLGDGSAQLRYNVGGYSPYKIEIARALDALGMPKPGVGQYLQDPANVTGGFDPAVAPEIVFLFDGTAVPAGVKDKVLPNAGVYDPAGNPMQGIALLAPARSPMPKTGEFDPLGPMAPYPAPWTNAIVSGPPAGMNATRENALEYTTALMAAADANRADMKRHVVLLRRLANPYLQPNDPTSAGFIPLLPVNPFITVDTKDWVPALDALHRGTGDLTNSRGERSVTSPTGYTPPAERFSIGKVQPYAGLSVGTPVANGDPTYAFPGSMVLRQAAVQAANNNMKHTFGRYNGTIGAPGPAGQTYAPGPPANLSGETLMTPFDWLVHMDRPLINPLELLHVTTGKPHEMTLQFITPNAAGTDVVKHAGTSGWLNPNTTLFRSLDLLRVQPYGHQTALGGRVPGKININTITDKRVFDALFDASIGNGFTQADVDALWQSLMQSRTANMDPNKRNAAGNPLQDTSGVTYSVPVPGATVYDMNMATGVGPPPVTYDRPFLPFGTAQAAFGSTFALGHGPGLDDTILRRNPAGLMPYIWNTNPATSPHPYQQAEAARKILNNTTTVSNTFAVWVTVGYFEATPVPSPVPGTTDYQLGKEYYKDVPGDARVRFFSIVDRTNVGIDPVSYQAFQADPVNNRPTHGQTRPFFTTVEASAPAGSPTISFATAGPGQIYVDGTLVTVTPGMSLVVGVGADREVVMTNAAIPPTYSGGVTQMTLVAPGLTRSHAIGECVSNVVPGNPGPQPTFDPALPQYQPVVPLMSRLP